MAAVVETQAATLTFADATGEVDVTFVQDTVNATVTLREMPDRPVVLVAEPYGAGPNVKKIKVTAYRAGARDRCRVPVAKGTVLKVTAVSYSA